MLVSICYGSTHVSKHAWQKPTCKVKHVLQKHTCKLTSIIEAYLRVSMFYRSIHASKHISRVRRSFSIRSGTKAEILFVSKWNRGVYFANARRKERKKAKAPSAKEKSANSSLPQGIPVFRAQRRTAGGKPRVLNKMYGMFWLSYLAVLFWPSFQLSSPFCFALAVLFSSLLLAVLCRQSRSDSSVLAVLFCLSACLILAVLL